MEDPTSKSKRTKPTATVNNAYSTLHKVKPDKCSIFDFTEDIQLLLLKLSHMDITQKLNGIIFSTLNQQEIDKVYKSINEAEITVIIQKRILQVTKMLIQLLDCQGQSTLQFAPQKSLGSHSFDCRVTPDFLLKIAYNNLLCIELKRPAIQILNKDDLPFEKDFNDIFTQSVHQCLLSSTPFGWVSDYYSTILYQIDIDVENEIKYNDYETQFDNITSYKKIPIKYVIIKEKQLLLYSIIFIRKIIRFFETHTQEKVENSMKTLSDVLTINTKEAKLEAKQYRLEIHHLLEKHLDGKTISFIRRDLCEIYV